MATIHIPDLYIKDTVEAMASYQRVVVGGNGVQDPEVYSLDRLSRDICLERPHQYSASMVPNRFVDERKSRKLALLPGPYDGKSGSILSIGPRTMADAPSSS
jgi:hypothetical protein